MHELYDVIKHRQVRHLVIPGSHDAGMAIISSTYVNGGNSGNTQTQGLQIYDQLRVGARWFDLRIVTVDTSGFWAAHVTDESKAGTYGATGQSFDSIVDDINKFTAENPGEIIFLSFRYLRRLRSLFDQAPSLWDEDTIKTFYGKLAKLQNRCPDLLKEVIDDPAGLNGALGKLNASYLFDKNNGAGCVVPLIYQHEDVIKPAFNISEGVYSLNHLLPDSNNDHWSNEDIPDAVAVDQAVFLQTVPRDGTSDDKFSIMQWVVTLNWRDFSAVSIASVAILPMNPALYSNGVNAMSPDHFPNVILQDYLGYLHPGEGKFPDDLGAEIRVLCIGLNLYMVSQNCIARRPPTRY